MVTEMFVLGIAAVAYSGYKIYKFAHSKRKKGRPELKNRDVKITKRKRIKKSGKNDQERNQDDNQDHIIQVKRGIENTEKAGYKMRKLWTHKNWDMYFKESRREGIRLRFEKDVCSEIREECIQFVQWLRKEYQFPM